MRFFFLKYLVINKNEMNKVFMWQNMTNKAAMVVLLFAAQLGFSQEEKFKYLIMAGEFDIAKYIVVLDMQNRTVLAMALSSSQNKFVKVVQKEFAGIDGAHVKIFFNKGRFEYDFNAEREGQPSRIEFVNEEIYREFIRDNSDGVMQYKEGNVVACTITPTNSTEWKYLIPENADIFASYEMKKVFKRLWEIKQGM